MGAWDRGEFPWQPQQADAHTDRKAWSSAQVRSKNICGPVALLSTDQSSRPMIPEPPCRLTAGRGRGWRARRRARGPGVPDPSTSPSPLLPVVPVPCLCNVVGWRPALPAGCSPESRRHPPPGRSAATARRGAPGRPRREAGGRVCKCARGGRGPPPRSG